MTSSNCLDIYRIIEPVGTSWDDVEWITVDTFVGIYEEAFIRSQKFSHYAEIQFYDGFNCKWRDV